MGTPLSDLYTAIFGFRPFFAGSSGSCAKGQPISGRDAAEIEGKQSRVIVDRAPGNVLLSRRASGLKKESVANVSQVVTLDRSLLTERVHKIPKAVLAEVDAGLRLVLQI